MAEKLTNKTYDENGEQQDIYEWSSASSLECNKKLGKLEDVMEKYGIESVEELDDLIQKIDGLILKASQVKRLNKQIDKITQDRDTWKKPVSWRVRN